MSKIFLSGTSGGLGGAVGNSFAVRVCAVMTPKHHTLITARPAQMNGIRCHTPPPHTDRTAATAPQLQALLRVGVVRSLARSALCCSQQARADRAWGLWMLHYFNSVQHGIVASFA